MTNVLFTRRVPGIRCQDSYVYIEVTREVNGSAVFFVYGRTSYLSSIFLRWFSDPNNAIIWAVESAHKAPEIEEWKRTHTWSPV